MKVSPTLLLKTDPEILHKGMQSAPSEFEFLVKLLARRYARKESDLQDLEQEARVAVFVAQSDYKVDSEMSLKNFVAFRIKHALKEFCRTQYRPGLVSLDEEVAEDQDGREMSRHDVIGVGPNQETTLSASIVAENIHCLTSEERGALLFRAEGRTLTEIATLLELKHFVTAHRLLEVARWKITQAKAAA